MILDVGGGGYDSAASALFGANQVGAINYNTLTGKLGGFAAMAGDDTTSEEFAREYDVAAKEAVDGMNDLVDAFATLGVLTATSIENHRNANAGSVYKQPAPVYSGGGSLPRGGPVDVPVYSPPSSLGGDNEDLPDFWNEIVDHLEGFAWPNADTGKLRSAADAWRSAATDVDRLAGYCDTAEAQLSGQTSPEIPLALDAFKDLQQSIRDLATSFRDVGQACDDYATEVETHRDIIKDIIRDMAIEAGISIVAGAVVGFFTFGGGAAVGGAIAASRIASAARKILAALRALKAAAKARAVAKLSSVVSKVKPLRAVLAKFKNAKKIDDAAAGVESAAKDALSPAVRANVDDAIQRAAAGKVRFPGHDGKPYMNSDGLLPPGRYTEWTAAESGAKRGADRVIISGDPAKPDAIYYWDHVNPPVRIGP